MARRYEHDIYDNLDNTALAFPAVTNGVNPNVFRFSAALQENIDPEILEDALNLSLIHICVSFIKYALFMLEQFLPLLFDKLTYHNFY